MKLAEALILRADCQKRIAQLKSRLLVNAKVQEGDAPAETPQELIAELGRVSTELLDLIKRINRTNSATAFAGRGTISDALAEQLNRSLGVKFSNFLPSDELQLRTRKLPSFHPTPGQSNLLRCPIGNERGLVVHGLS